MRKTVKERVDEFIPKKPKNATLSAREMDEIWQTGSVFECVRYAFYFGYMRGIKSKKGGIA